MYASLGQAFAMATYANAAAHGKQVHLGLDSLWFDNVVACEFTVGWDHELVATTFHDWLSYIKSGFSSAYIWIEPLRTIDRIDATALGEVHWAPVTAGSQDVIWHCQEQERTRNKWEHHYGSFTIQPGQFCIRSSVADAYENLKIAFNDGLTYSKEHRNGECSQRFVQGIEALESDTFDPRVHSLFPQGYGVDAHRLAHSVLRAWCFAGMGSWNDYIAPSDELQKRFEDTTLRLYEAFGKGLYAASRDFAAR